ncbi:MAG: tetratricopeptide repeat protein [Thermomicrobiales bacterium]
MSVRDAATDEARDTMSPPSMVQPQSGINDSELRQIVDVATSYLETGLFDDADDILQEVLEAGAVSPEIEELIRRIEEARGESGHSGTSMLDDVEESRPVRRQPLIHLTAPLPGADRLPRPVQRLIAETERDFNDGRRHSALDLCYVVTAQAPEFVPNYLRAAQIRIALGDIEGAMGLVESVERLQAMDGIEDDPMLRSIRVALNPDDVEGLVEHARYLLGQQVVGAGDPFLPAAIEATQEADPATARELSKALVERRPNDDTAIRTYVRAAVTTGEPDEIHAALRERVRQESTAIDLLWWRAASGMVNDEPDWPEWLTRATNLVRMKTDNYGQARVAIDRSASFAPDHVRYLGGAIFALAAAQWDVAQAELEDWKISAGENASSLEAFVGACAQVEVIEYLGLQGLIPALDDLISAFVKLTHQDIPTNFDLFSMQTSQQELFERYRIAIGIHDEINHGLDFLKRLVESSPDDLGLRQSYAQILIEHGKLNDGIRELRAIAKAREQAGDLQAMAEAMRSISQAVPENLEIKQMLIDVYLRRGILDEALRELELVASLKHDAYDIAGAIQAYTRAAEIACAMGNFALGNELYDRGVAADPDNVPVRHAAVAFYLQTGAVDRATEHLREVVRIAPSEQDPDEAVAALHQIIGLDPNNFDSYHKLGEVLTAMGEYKQAERVYRRLAEIAPNDPVLQAKQSALAVLAATG